MATIRISCPITWHERYDWLSDYSNTFIDTTSWAAWQIGYDDITVIVDDDVAILYYLTWP